MPLEACMICIDNSEWMRNGDYAPTRLEAQAETVSYISNAKLQDNPESEVGLLSMAGSRVEVHCSMSRNIGNIMSCLQDNVHVGGEAKFTQGLKVAQLGLKNRQNKNQKQRIIIFVGSPIKEQTKDLVKLGKVFKKNNVAVDVINFGAENSENENTEKLEAFVGAANNSDNSHLLNVPPGPHILSDLVLTSSIMSDNPAAAAAAGAGGAMGGGDDMGGMDEDLAMAIRMSMEDERQRQAAAAGGGDAAPAAVSETAAATAETTPAPQAAAPMEDDDYDEDDEDELLAQAIALSMAENNAMEETAPAPTTPAPAAATTTATPTPATTTAAPAEEELEDDIANALKDKDFLEGLLSSVPGVDKDDIAIDDILMNLGGDDEDEAEKKDEKK